MSKVERYKVERYKRVTVLVPRELADRIQGVQSDVVRRALARELGFEAPPLVKRGRPKRAVGVPNVAG